MEEEKSAEGADKVVGVGIFAFVFYLVIPILFIALLTWLRGNGFGCSGPPPPFFGL